MKVSTHASSLLLCLLSLVLMANALGGGVVDEVDASFGSEHQFGLLRMSVGDLKKGELSAKHLAFCSQALKRAFNAIHAEANDDLFFVDSNITAVELQKEKRKRRGEGLSGSSTLERIFGWTYFDEDTDEEDEAESLTYSRADWIRMRTKWRGSFYNQFDITCHLCKKDDDALDLSSALGGGDDAKWSHPQAIADLFCKILKAEGDKVVFARVRDCRFFPVSSLGEWDMTTGVSTPTTTVAADDSNHVAITLGGLDCADEPEVCNGKELRQLVSDAFTLAYNQVYFHEYNLRDFTPTSFVLYEDTTEPAAVGSVLRGVGMDLTMDTDGRLPVGIWRGTIHVEDRFLDQAAAHPQKNQLASLEQVEEIFCGLMANFKDDENHDGEKEKAILSTWETCSIASFMLINPAEYRELAADAAAEAE